MEDRLFHIATEDEIKSGEITDVYFIRDTEVLKAKGIQKHVLGEARPAMLPNS